MPELKKSLENPSTFKEIYNFSYTFSCPKVIIPCSSEKYLYDCYMLATASHSRCFSSVAWAQTSSPVKVWSFGVPYTQRHDSFPT